MCQGIGKTFFTDFLARFVFGEDITVQFNGISDIVDKFNLRLAGKKLSVNNETSSTREEFRSSFEKLKSLVTDSRQSIQKKFVDTYEIDNICSWMFLTNNIDSFIIEDSNRRYVCLDVNPIHKDDSEYFENL